MGDTKTEKKKTSRWSRIKSAPKNWSVATWSTIALVVLLVGGVTLCWTMFQYHQESVPWKHYMTWPRFLLVVGLLIAIPIVFHKGIRLWLQGDVSRFPELEKAWKAGVQALREAGIALDETPIFLIVGSNGEAQERAIMNMSATPATVNGVPKGPSPLHWYASPEAIYLFCSDASWLSALNRLRLTREEEAIESMTDAISSVKLVASDVDVAPIPSPGSAPPPQPVATTPLITVPPIAPGPAAPRGPVLPAVRRPSAPAAKTEIRGTMMLDDFVGGFGGGAANDFEPAAPSGQVTGTILLDEPEPQESYAPTPTATVDTYAFVQTAVDRRPVVVAPRDSSQRLQRLQALCQRLRLARQPLCAVNGVLALLPFEIIHATADETEELERAVKSDLGVVQNELQLRAPVTALVVGLEKESGFRELVRRVGREKSATQRFGGRFDVRSDSSKEALRSFSAHVCGAFEDWAYTLFRAKGSLSRPGNAKLYSLLCKVRCILKSKLGRVLGNGIGFDSRREERDEPHLFSGCYFASTGRTQDRQAFARGVLEKLLSEQEQIEWTHRAIRQQRRCQQFLIAGIVLDAILIGTLLAAMF
ncbi:MAG: hypothetical protein KDA99_06640 [Planctomycetales bacterium]|nr:hypothetical protein [Planctomycetales bacterium]